MLPNPLSKHLYREKKPFLVLAWALAAVGLWAGVHSSGDAGACPGADRGGQAGDQTVALCDAIGRAGAGFCAARVVDAGAAERVDEK